MRLLRLRHGPKSRSQPFTALRERSSAPSSRIPKRTRWPSCSNSSRWSAISSAVRRIFPWRRTGIILNLFGCLVGETSKGRKGVSVGYPKRLLGTVDDVWAKSRIMSGLSSGEGLIWYVRDPISKQGKDGEEECVDAGEPDKRLLVVEPEFARVLRVLAREGNTLSAIIRHAWDDGTLQTMVSGRRIAPVRATDAHVSIIGHITVDELRRNLTETETSNGFANRFLWCCVRRSQAVAGRRACILRRPLLHSPTSSRPPSLMPGKPGRCSAMKLRVPGGPPSTKHSRRASQASSAMSPPGRKRKCSVSRVSMPCWTSLPSSRWLTLEAALALWRYCEASARYIFGDALGDALADEIFHMLRAVAPDGLTRTDIYNAFGRNKKSTTIQQALAGLWRHQLVTYTTEATAGRPIERWYARLSSSASTQKTHLTQKGLLPYTTLRSRHPLMRLMRLMRSRRERTGRRMARRRLVRMGGHRSMRGSRCVSTVEQSCLAPVFVDLTASALWCSTCGVTVSFRTLTQLDGTDVYLCNTCDTEVGRKHTTAPPSTNGTPTPDDAPQAGPPSSGNEEDDDFADIPF